MFLANIKKSIAFFFIIIFSNYIADLLPCNLKKLLKNIYFKHFIGFMIIFFILDISNEVTHSTIIMEILYTAFIYLLFVLITATKSYIFYLLLLLLILYYYLSTLDDRNIYSIENLSDNFFLKFLMTYKSVVSIIVLFLIIVGLFINYREKKARFGKKFTFLKLIFDRDIC